MSNFIIQAILDVRYESSYPTVALFGELYQLGYTNVAETPFRNIPKEVRDSNPDLKYQAMYQVSSNQTEYKANIGDNIFGISTTEYTSWSDFILNARKVFKILFDKTSNDLKISRIGLRYVDLIENHNIFDDQHIKIEISKKNKNTANTINLRFEETMNENQIVEQIIYPFKKPEDQDIKGTFIDITTSRDGVKLEVPFIEKEFLSISNTLHDINKTKFKEILSDELRRQIDLQ